jgi:hypothetical protein
MSIAGALLQRYLNGDLPHRCFGAEPAIERIGSSITFESSRSVPAIGAARAVPSVSLWPRRARKKARFVTCDMEFPSPLTPVIGE